ncbi:hypothetical protein D9M68_761780 [compost metagenome]
MWWVKTAVQIVVKNVSNFWKPKDKREWGFDLGGAGGKKVFMPTERQIDGQYLGIDGLLYPLVRPAQKLSDIDKKAAVFGGNSDLSKYVYVGTSDAGDKLYRVKDYVLPMYKADQKRIDDANNSVASPAASNPVPKLLLKDVLLGTQQVQQVQGVKTVEKSAVTPVSGFSYTVAGIVIGSVLLVSYAVSE